MTLLSDDDARKQSCPFFRFVVNEKDVVHHRVPAIYVHESCKGSDCKIGWRWGPGGEACGMGFCGSFGAPLDPPLTVIKPETI